MNNPLSLEVGCPVRAADHGLSLGTLDDQGEAVPGMPLRALGRFLFLWGQLRLFFGFPVDSLEFGHGGCS